MADKQTRLKSKSSVTAMTKSQNLQQNIHKPQFGSWHAEYKATSEVAYALHTFQLSKRCFVTSDHYTVSCSFTSIGTIRSFRRVILSLRRMVPSRCLLYVTKTETKWRRERSVGTVRATRSRNYGSIPGTAKEIDFSLLNVYTSSGPNQPLNECVILGLSPRRVKRPGSDVESSLQYIVEVKKVELLLRLPCGP